MVAGRLKRSGVPGMPETAASSRIPVRITSTKPVEAWREFVKKRWNPETKYLNLDVSWNCA
jgi:nuclear RNA export factor